jgi:hypothetical protein
MADTAIRSTDAATVAGPQAPAEGSRSEEGREEERSAGEMSAVIEVELLKTILKRPIAFHRVFAEIGGGVAAGLMLSQAWYWSQRTDDPNGWFWKTAQDWQEETALTRREQEGARRSLRATGFWQEERRGVPAKLFFRIDVKKLAASLSRKGNGQFREQAKSSFNKSAKLDSTNHRN